MKIWVTRHGQTNLNLKKLMQGLTDEPLNENGLGQAQAARKRIGEVHFDAVFASPLDRAIVTGSVIGGVTKEQVIIDPRIIETDFGKYEQRPYSAMGPFMGLYWALPEVFPAPKGVETISSMKARAASFLKEVEKRGLAEGWEQVLIACHGGIMRVLSGYLEGRKNGLLWRPKPHNCEIRVYERIGQAKFVRTDTILGTR